MNAYDWSTFHVTTYERADRAMLFSCFATARGLERFFIDEAAHEAPDGTPRQPDERVQPGDRYRWRFLHPFEIEGTFEAVELDRFVRFTFGAMTVEVTFRDVEDAVEIDLRQTGCATEDPARAWQHLNCRSCWIFFLTNLRSVLRTGEDLRDREHPARNDSISIGWRRTEA